jgi:putative flippase GtrA
MRSDLSRIPWFLAVGGSAAFMHLAVVAVLVERFHVSPLMANLGGFFVAFCLSFSGHYLLTFRDLKAGLLPSLIRFLFIALLGFAVNQMVYAVLLDWVGVKWYFPALFVVLLGVAIMTFTLSRRWGFAK